MNTITNKSIINLTCDKCGKKYQIIGKLYKQRIRRGNPNFCKECMKLYAVKNANKTKANMSEERKTEYSRKLTEANIHKWKYMDQKEKDRRFDLLRKQNQERLKAWNEESSKIQGLKIKEGHSKMSKEAKQKMHDKQSESMVKYHKNKTQKERELFSNQVKDGMSKMSKEEKDNMKQAWINWWNSLSDKEQHDHVKSTIMLSACGNNLHRKFENYFNNSALSKEFKILPEIVLSNETSHSWDYGIYNVNNELVAVVDLDGAYFHADICDYDGLHSKEEYDESRSLSIPASIRCFIIREILFEKDFSFLLKSMNVDYDEYVMSLFNKYRAMPFPSPQYNDKELITSYMNLVKMNCDDKYHKDISLNTRIGDRLIQHFHPSIYRAHRRNEISPHDAWYDDELLMKCIRNRIIYQTYLNPNKILQGFNIAKIAPKVSVFSAGRAKLLIHKYLNEYDTIFDPFSGFSGRMLGAVSLGKRYIGQDISLIHVNESNKLISFLQKYSNIYATISQDDILQSFGTYQCLFTCPPYSDKEQWVDVQVDQRSCDDWIDICLSHFKCKRYLFVIDNTEKYKDYIVEEIHNKSHFSINKEYVVII